MPNLPSTIAPPFVGQTIAISDSDNGIITTLYSGSNGVCNPSYQLSSLVRLQNNFVELNLTRDESWYSGLQKPLDPSSGSNNITIAMNGWCWSEKQACYLHRQTGWPAWTTEHSCRVWRETVQYRRPGTSFGRGVSSWTGFHPEAEEVEQVPGVFEWPVWIWDRRRRRHCWIRSWGWETLLGSVESAEVYGGCL